MSDLQQDIVAVGLNLEPETLIKAYSNGIFPWPTPGYPLLWYCPKKRALLKFENLNIGKRLHQYLKSSRWTFTLNRSFHQVIEACGERGEEGTWITDDMMAAYVKMHELGHAHSVEVWETVDGKTDSILIGGLYGVDMAGTFAGESMFHKKNHASKAAVLFAIHLLKELGREFIDIQVMTPHMEAFGATEISRGKFIKLIEAVKEARNKSSQVNGSEEFNAFSDDKTWYYDVATPGNFIEG